ncbi:transposon Ty3-I Gag-Pol polyprotein [Trichonephila inaurata madagascariensis]|uniref:Transposon Ty3-I Gag-Pol polyprotein n=1 Tax=Trichonephila inaurata madagascariensis TaxID=2747483 RepID=A0A8X6X2G5_9ARAC|nr:transposon Ty3-I Gag-Pol polyprotein [Trichonephila inaurata madagascariensis]
MSLETPQGSSLIKDPHLLPPHFFLPKQITVINKTSIISPIQLVFQDLMAKLKNKIPPSLLCCQNFLWSILRNGTLTYQQEILNSTFQRSIKMTPFELLFGTKMKSCHDIEIFQLLNDEITAQFQQQCDTLHQDAKKQIYKVQDENRRTYNLRCRQAPKYQLHDLVAIKHTQFGPGLKLKQKYLGSYKVTKVKHNDTYDVEKCDFVNGPSKTSTCAQFMKLAKSN